MPTAATEKVAFCPCGVLCDCGCVVIAGAALLVVADGVVVPVELLSLLFPPPPQPVTMTAHASATASGRKPAGTFHLPVRFTPEGARSASLS